MEFITIGDRQIAIERRPGASPGLFWLGGYNSDMRGAKAATVDAWGGEQGLAVTRFDYSGHGESPGEISEHTISDWLEESLVVFDTTDGPQIIVGSSMGGWLALLLAREHRRRQGDRIKGMVLIAPATDMTEVLIWGGFTKKQKKILEAQGVVEEASGYGEPYKFTRGFIEDGRQHLLFGRAIEVGAPIAILQGAQDKDVPKEHAAKLVEHIVTDIVTFTLVPDGDHRLSRPEDLKLLESTLARIVKQSGEELRRELVSAPRSSS